MVPEGWEIRKGSELSAVITKGASPRWQGFKYQDDGLLFVTSENVRDGYLDVSSPKFLPNEFSEKERKSQLKFGDILINIVGASIGRSCRFELDGTNANINQAVCLFRPLNKSVGDYVIHYLQSSEAIKKLLGKQTESARPNLSLSDIRGLRLPLPPSGERDKISRVLSTWDQAIEATEKLIANSERQKKALMQQLLTGKKRLPGFSGEWKTIRLGEVGKITSAGVDKKIKDGEKPVRLLNFVDAYHREFVNDADLEQEVTAPERKVKNCNVLRGDIFLTPSSETRDDIGLAVVANEDMSGVCYSYHVIRLRLSQDWDQYFRAYVFQTDEYRRQAYRLGDGSGQRYVISQDGFRDITLTVPPIKEQQAIGSVLKNCTDTILELKSKLEHLKQEKAALMQQLLTGKRRVKIGEEIAA